MTAVIREAFTMRLKPGAAAEYKRRHDEIWPELARQHTDAGIRNYTIFLDPETGVLFATRELADGHTVAAMPDDPVVRRWWAYMADLMECLPSNQPVGKALVEVFHMD